MRTIAVEVPFQYALHGAKARSRTSRRWIARDVVGVDVPDIEIAEVDVVVPRYRPSALRNPDMLSIGRGLPPEEMVAAIRGSRPFRAYGFVNGMRYLWGGKLWSPVHGDATRHEIPRDKYVAFVREALTTSDWSPFRSNPFALDGARTRIMKTDLVDAGAIRVESEERGDAERLALADADEMAFIGGVLHTSRWEPVAELRWFGTGAEGRSCVVRDVLVPDDADHGVKTMTVAFSDLDAYVRVLDHDKGADEPIGIDAHMPDLATWTPRYRTFEANAVATARRLLHDVLPRNGGLGSLGGGTIVDTDMPHRIHDAAFGVRDLLRGVPSDLRLADPETHAGLCLDIVEASEALAGEIERHAARPGVLVRYDTVYATAPVRRLRAAWDLVEAPRRSKAIDGADLRGIETIGP